jgi:hypothetical protein
MKNTFLIILISLLSIIQVFSQDVALDTSFKETAKLKKVSFEANAGIGLGFVQDKNSPIYYFKLGIGNDGFKLQLVGTSNYFFSTRSDNSRELAVDKYAGLEWLMPSSSWGNKGYLNRGDDNWGGIGVSYCIQNDSELHEKTPFKGYVVYYFGIVSITAEYVWSDFSYPGVSVRFDY